jgi:hypothetical protein
MTLQVFTARIGRWMKGEPDAIDITRKSARPEWLFLAPSWAILGPALEARKRADALLAECKRQADLLGGYEDAHGHPTFDPFPYQLDGEAIMNAAWTEYKPAFLDEMRASWRERRPMWDVLLSRQRVVLCCYCSDAAHCHRTILRRDILPKLGAEDCGEIAKGDHR